MLPEPESRAAAAFGPVMDGKTVLVTGACTGLGFEMARGFSEAGATVLVHGRSLDRAERAAERLERGMPIAFDVADRADADRAIRRALEHHGRIDVLVGNAAIRDRRRFLETDVESFGTVLDVDLVANFALARALVPDMIQGGGGQIIFISSTAAVRGPHVGSTYAAAKAALEGLTRALAVELGPSNIRVNAISPGFFATEFNRGLAQERQTGEMIARQVPLGRWARPEEIVGPALFLASPASSYISGITLFVDGGMTASS